MTEYLWQFRISQGEACLSDHGVAFFAGKSSEMAEMLGCLLVETKNVKLDEWHNDVLMVSGIAVLGG
jgi:hypothetical protein